MHGQADAVSFVVYPVDTVETINVVEQTLRLARTTALNFVFGPMDLKELKRDGWLVAGNDAEAVRALLVKVISDLKIQDVE